MSDSPHSSADTGPAGWPQAATGPDAARWRMTRRSVLHGSALGAAVAALELFKHSAAVPRRNALPAASQAASTGAGQGLPDIQFDLANFIAPVQTIDGVQVQFGPVHTVFATAQLLRAPTRSDQNLLNRALATIEAAYPFTPGGIFTLVSYGLPYFNRLPGAVKGPLVSRHMPRLSNDTSRLVLEEAVPGPTDVSPGNPQITKERFNVPVVIEDNDMLFTFRSDIAANIQDVLNWLEGSNRLAGQRLFSPQLGGLLTFTSSRAMFGQIGLPRKVADASALSYAFMVNPESSMWMGFIDQQTAGSSPAAPVTFEVTPLTTAEPGDYFDNGSVQHLSHVIMDLQQFYNVDDNGVPISEDSDYIERVQYMFRSTPPPSNGYTDQITDGGGPAFLNNTFQGRGDARTGARGIGTPGAEHRLGHLSGLQRSSRTPGGQPLHLRMDGPGFDNMDVPDNSQQPKLQFTVFVPTADFFATMRRNQASLDLAAAYSVPDSDNGLERFLTATRRQNYLIPPRRHRAFPLTELT